VYGDLKPVQVSVQNFPFFQLPNDYLCGHFGIKAKFTKGTGGNKKRKREMGEQVFLSITCPYIYALTRKEIHSCKKYTHALEKIHSCFGKNTLMI
jgi:hypothetical protein